MRFNFTKMIRRFGTPLQVELKSGIDGGHYDDAGTWVTGNDVDIIKINEPLLPTGSNLNQQANFMYTSGGEVMTYDMYWYSERKNVPLQTIVTDLNTGIKYVVANYSDYTNYSTITIYGLKAVKRYEDAIQLP